VPGRSFSTSVKSSSARRRCFRFQWNAWWAVTVASQPRSAPLCRSEGSSEKSSTQTDWKMSAASSRLAPYFRGIE
jgi:hypothetical protein